MELEFGGLTHTHASLEWVLRSIHQTLHLDRATRFVALGLPRELLGNERRVGGDIRCTHGTDRLGVGGRYVLFHSGVAIEILAPFPDRVVSFTEKHGPRMLRRSFPHLLSLLRTLARVHLILGASTGAVTLIVLIGRCQLDA